MRWLALALLVMAAWAPPAAARDLEGLGPAPQPCVAVPGPDCTYDSRWGQLTFAPRVVPAGGMVEGTISGRCASDPPGTCQIVWGFPGCGNVLVCRWRVPKDGAANKWQLYSVAIGTPQGGSTSVNYFAVIGKPMIEGDVVDKDGTAIANAKVTLTRAGIVGSGSAHTDAAGHYSVFVRTGRPYTVTVKAGDGTGLPTTCTGKATRNRCVVDPDARMINTASFEITNAPNFDYTLPDRFGPRDRDGKIHEMTTPEEIDPAEWTADFNVTRPDGRPCARNATYSWEVDGTPVEMTRGTGIRACRFRYAHFSHLGKFDVKLVTKTPNGEQGTTKTILLRDFLIAALGDSIASGEGNPDIGAGTIRRAVWQLKKCNRSARAHGALEALAIEKLDEKTSVTFVHLGCSGALLKEGLLLPYPGANPAEPPPGDLPPQGTELARLVGRREVDAVVLNGAANDVSFGPISAFCATDGNIKDCQRRVPDNASYPRDKEYEDAHGGKPGTLDQITRWRLTLLPDRYAQVASVLDPVLSGARDRVYITQYPDPTHDKKGEFCEEMIATPKGAIDGEEVEWAYLVVVSGLNKAVRATAGLGWQPIAHTANDFRRHGYCAGSQTWIRTLTGSAGLQRNIGGTLHPNAPGTKAIADRVIPVLKGDLYPGGEPRPTRNPDGRRG